jgi:hypothetical protein
VELLLFELLRLTVGVELLLLELLRLTVGAELLLEDEVLLEALVGVVVVRVRTELVVLLLLFVVERLSDVSALASFVEERLVVVLSFAEALRVRPLLSIELLLSVLSVTELLLPLLSETELTLLLLDLDNVLSEDEPERADAELLRVAYLPLEREAPAVRPY